MYCIFRNVYSIVLFILFSGLGVSTNKNIIVIIIIHNFLGSALQLSSPSHSHSLVLYFRDDE
jgi:hypothetical protein